MGRAAALMAALMAGLVWTGRAQAAEPVKQAMPPQQQQGRFVIVFGPFARADVYLLDTQTGRTWRDVQFTSLTGQPEAWQPMPQINTVADELALEQAHPPVRTAPANPK